MPCFDKQFIAARGQPISYNGFSLVRIDRFPVRNGDTLICSIEKSINKKGVIQGFCIDITGQADIDRKIFKKDKGIRLMFWTNSMPDQQKIKIITKSDNVLIYNICEEEVTYLDNDKTGAPLERHSKRISYWMGGAAMIVEEIEGGRRYRCSDTSAAEKPFPFNDIVFTVRNIEQNV